MQGKINPTNYEAYFLLYVDNELSREEQSEVEAFLEQHPELQPLLEELLRTRQMADPADVFPDKSRLLFDGASVSDEALLSFLDKEAVSAEALQQLQGPSPELQQRLAAFSATVSVPDEDVVFPDKNRLYRSSKLVFFKKWGMAAAAAVVLIAVGAGIWMQGQEEGSALAGVEYVGDSSLNMVIAHVAPDKDDTIADTRPQTGNTSKEAIVAADKPIADKEKRTPVPKQPAKIPVPVAPPATVRQPVAASAPSTTAPRNAGVTPAPDAKPLIAKDNSAPQAVPEQDPSVQQAVATTADEKTPKTKKSLFKKLTQRIEERVTGTLTDDDGQVTIAGFAVNVK
ncbi:hypothetical protein [Niabella beijingensis]|uniref:hypothetical protein n=1 Tax=Niabella beijingensis TaxID=2872700 RepID=UPI001CBE6A15|nr:hypothetical protein [Niabella beijingensis]MBZ4190044.1 hypothetical protein [Niabella beijingensis]